MVQKSREGSPATAETYLSRLIKFCRENEVSPEKLLEMSDEELRDVLMDYVSRLTELELPGSYITTIVSFLSVLSRQHKVAIKTKQRVLIPPYRPILQHHLQVPLMQYQLL